MTLPPHHIGDAAWSRKRCSRCRTRRPVGMFRADRRASDGLRSQCAICESAACREWYWRRKAADPAAVSARNIEAGRRYRARLAAGGGIG
jgi:hypothetical protein